MRIFVDELPKYCEECPCCNSDYEKGYCCNLGVFNEETCDYSLVGKQRCIDCPLQSLTDYTKQVRKEVCEEIRKTLFEYLKVNSMEELENLSLLDSTLTYDVITDKIDQIQGETKNAETK